MKDRIGEQSKSLYGTVCKIIDVSPNGIYVQFQDEHKVIVHTGYDMFLQCHVKNPYDKSLYGHGYLGEGNYKTSVHSKPDFKYLVWQGILRRCYDEKFNNTKPTYKGCSMCNEWMNYQTFAKWFEDNYYEVSNERMHLDKDIMYKNNKIYSPETCTIVPQRINVLFVNNHARRGDLPVGVQSTGRRYRAICTVFGEYYHPGEKRNTAEEAFGDYKKFKEDLIKKVADEYKGKIPNKLYDAMYRYKIEIDD